LNPDPRYWLGNLIGHLRHLFSAESQQTKQRGFLAIGALDVIESCSDPFPRNPDNKRNVFQTMSRAFSASYVSN
jgi:hypothetical protein